jgi:alpha-L-rhamnosidase
MQPSLTVEHRRDDDRLGLGEAAPRLSWVTATDEPGWHQTAHEVEVAAPDLDADPGSRSGDGDRTGRPTDGDTDGYTTGRRTGGDAGGGTAHWSTGRVESDESVLVPWPAAPLGSRQRRTVRVRVWGPRGSGPSDWSRPVTFETGLLDPADWTARFVAPAVAADPVAPGDEIAPCPVLRTEVDLPCAPRRARLYVTALGVYEIELNGRRLGDHVLAPGWSSYGHRLRYETHDVTDQLQPGRNALGAVLGDGWFRGRLGFDGGKRDVYGDRLALLAQLEVIDADGTTHTFGTGIPGAGGWRAATGPVVRSGIYAGETHDARREQPGWSSPGFDDTGWGDVEGLDRDLATLVARVGPPVRRTGELRPVAITTSPTGRTVVDFGQNLVGRLRVTLPADPGPAGATITLRHAEILQDGDLCTEPLRLAEATDRYVVGPESGGATWEPRFTFHGFRYAEVDGWPGTLTADDLVAVVTHSDMERTGWFACSDPRVVRLHENIVWSMRGNFLDVPTDCPQRDERLGWTGDIQVFAPTAGFLYDVTGLLASWLADLAADQGDDGVVPFVVPDCVRYGLGASAWGDAATVVPWVLHQGAGDRGVLAAQYPSMVAWVEFVLRRAGADLLWDDGFQFGDWLDPHAPPADPFDGRTDPHLVANAYLVRSLDIVAATAELLGEDHDARRYRDLAGEARAAFAGEYVTPAGRLASDSQTAYALALRFDLLPEPGQRDRAGRRLAELVERAGHTIATGFVGTPLVSDALCDAGFAGAAYRLLLQDACPSWLYPVTMGATTVWERWDGIRPDGSLDPGAMRMNSFNHYALGAVGDWLHRRVGGLAPAAPGYRRLRIAPVVDPAARAGGGITWASSRHRTPYGEAGSAWRIEGDRFELTATVPPGTTATVVLPFGGGEPIEVAAGTHRWTTEIPAGGT